MDNKADVNARDKNGNTPIHLAGSSKHGTKDEKERCCELLIKAGCDWNIKNDKGKTPLDYAVVKKVAIQTTTDFIYHISTNYH